MDFSKHDGLQNVFGEAQRGRNGGFVVNWDLLKEEDARLVYSIVEKAIKLSVIRPEHRLDFEMDVGACHRVEPLDLAAFYSAETNDFINACVGIIRKFDRLTGEFFNGFIPEYALCKVYRKKGGDLK